MPSQKYFNLLFAGIIAPTLPFAFVPCRQRQDPNGNDGPRNFTGEKISGEKDNKGKKNESYGGERASNPWAKGEKDGHGPYSAYFRSDA